MSAMVYSIPDCFMTAFVAGLVFALVYEALRIIRILLPFRTVTFVCDILFFLLAAAAVTRISLLLGNYIRGYTVLGFGAGIFTYITTAGRLINKLENAIAETVRAMLKAFFSALSRVMRSCFSFIAHKLSDGFGKIHKKSVNTLKKMLKPLKNKPKMVYNKINCNKNKGRSETGHVIQAKVRRSNDA